MSESKTILHVEDNFDNRLLVRRLLAASGYRIVEAENGSQALKVLSKIHPDMILMDINMPDMDGYTLTDQIKRNPVMSGVPIVAITANVLKGDKERTLDAGCDGYIEKPIDVDQFVDQIEMFLK